MKIDVCSIDKCQSELIWNGCAIKRLFESRSEFMAIRHSRLHSGNLKSTCNKYVSIRSKLRNKMLLGAHQNLCSSHFTNHQYSIFRTVRHNEMRHERRLRWAARVDAPNFAHSKKKKNTCFLLKIPQRLRSTKVATSMNNVKHTISKPNAVTDDALAATKWQRSRRVMEIMNAKVCSNNNRIFLRVGGLWWKFMGSLCVRVSKTPSFKLCY